MIMLLNVTCFGNLLFDEKSKYFLEIIIMRIIAIIIIILIIIVIIIIIIILIVIIIIPGQFLKRR